jgi:excinuclease ABC subunit C
LVLDHASGAIRLLQRIRDEAHRFANGYHQLLMKQRMNESILDECPGVSENRKRLLLRHFNSIERLRNATVEEICAIEGIGPKLAETLVEFFAKWKRRGDPVEADASPDETEGDDTTPLNPEEEKAQGHQLAEEPAEIGPEATLPVPEQEGAVTYVLKPSPMRKP